MADARPAVFVLNGPNLNLLGVRQPEIYGAETLADIEAACRATAEALSLTLTFRQSNHEGELVDWLHEARDAADAVILNAAAYTHTSVAIHDALKAYDGLKIELHLSNPHRREPFRHVSHVATAADGVIAGFGPMGYPLALQAAARRLSARAP
jgi:3-dehydroquinate dehydratase-2